MPISNVFQRGPGLHWWRRVYLCWYGMGREWGISWLLFGCTGRLCHYMPRTEVFQGGPILCGREWIQVLRWNLASR